MVQKMPFRLDAGCNAIQAIFMHAYTQFVFCRVALMKTTAFKYEPVMVAFRVDGG